MKRKVLTGTSEKTSKVLRKVGSFKNTDKEWYYLSRGGYRP